MTFSAKDWSVLGRLIVSLVVLAVSIYIVLSNHYPDAHNKWAFGMIGLIVGYWLK